MVAFAFRVAELTFSFRVRVCVRVCVCVRALGGEMRCVLETYVSEVDVCFVVTQ